jgi:hypothetical protein
MSSRGVGPGTERVGRFIGRVGVMTLPAVQVGLDLDERVVRRHVQRLEDLGWLTRKTWMWGEGSVVWLTAAGINGVGLHGLRAVKVRREKSEPGITTITRGILVGFSAARLERRGYEWLSSRELAVDEPRWAVRHRHDYGHGTQLPDLVVWVPGSEKPVAIVCEESRRREDRQRWRLEGWRDALNAGRYECVQYDCANEPLATWINAFVHWLTVRGAVETGFISTYLGDFLGWLRLPSETLMRGVEPILSAAAAIQEQADALGLGDGIGAGGSGKDALLAVDADEEEDAPDQDADGQGESAQGHDVHGLVQRVERRERTENRKRD